ncbi:hypothetical protein EPN15_01255 [Patescibacteria group bacterium]|nr:MAG: hypothetical protein EPN15_01255 [Patescibacteria group bacterium]
MDLRHLFIPEPPLTALAISQEAAVLLSLKKTSKGLKKEFIQRQVLPLGTIEKGELKNEKEFTKAVQACFDAVSKKRIKKFPNIIMAIPDDQVYVSALDFPDALEADEIDDALKVNAPMKLPYPLEAAYYDKEPLIPVKRGRQEFIFAQIAKKTVDAYLAALEKIGLNTVVLGYTNASVLRALKFTDDDPAIIIRECGDGWEISCIAKKQMRFLDRVRNLSDSKIPKYETVSKAIENLSYYAETEFGLVSKKALYMGGNTALSAKMSANIEKDLKNKGFDIAFLPLKEFVKPEILALEKEENLPPLLPAYGLGLRSVISRDEDTMISLLPVGTEEAYKVKRNIVYARTLVFTVSTVAIGLMLVFGLIFAFMKWMGEGLHANYQQASSQLLMNGVQNLEKEVNEFNSFLSIIDQAVGGKNTISPIVSDLQKMIVPGVILNSIQISSLDAPISISGTAQTRDQAINFKNKLAESENFSDIELPLSSLKSENNVSFQITMKYQPRQ